MSNATIGSYTAGEWSKIQADARTYQQLRKEYGSLKEAQKQGVNTKNTRSGLSLSNAYNTTRVMSGNRQYKTNISKRTGYHLEGKETSYNRNATMSVKVGAGHRVQNTRAAGGAKAGQTNKDRSGRLRNAQKDLSRSPAARSAFGKAVASGIKQSMTKGRNSSSNTSSKKTTTKSKAKPKYNGSNRKDSTNKYYSRKTHKYYPSTASKKRAESRKRR